jgi:hypothetical protein
MKLMSLNFYELHDRLKLYGNEYKQVKKEVLKELSLSLKEQSTDCEGLKMKIEEKYQNTISIVRETFHVYIERLSSLVEVKEMMNVEKIRNDNIASGAESLKKKYTMILNEYNYKPSQQPSFELENKQNKSFEERRQTRAITKEEMNWIGGMENEERASRLSASKVINSTEDKNVNELDVAKKNIINEQNLKIKENNN